MKQLFTTLGCALLIAGSAISANAATVTKVDPTPGGTVPTTMNQVNIYFEDITSADQINVDGANIIFRNDGGSIGEGSAQVGDENGSYFLKLLWDQTAESVGVGNTLTVRIMGTITIKGENLSLSNFGGMKGVSDFLGFAIDLTYTVSGDSTGTPDPEPDPSESWIPLDYDSPQTAVQDEIYSFTAESENAYILTNKTDYLTISDMMAVYKNGEMSQQVSLSVVERGAGNVYNMSGLETGETYTINFGDALYGAVRIELKNGVYEPDPIAISLNQQITLNPNQPYYYTATGNGSMIVEVETDDPATFAEQSFVYSDASHQSALADVETETGTNSVTYTFDVTESTDYYFYFTGASYKMAEFTFTQNQVVPEYMEEATNLSPEISVSDMYPAVELTWNNELVTLIDDELTVAVSFNDEEIGTLTVEDMNLVPSVENEPGIEIQAELEDSGNILYLLFGTAGLARGEGAYTFEIPEGLVKNEKGQINPAQTVSVVMTGLAAGEVSPIDGTTFEEGEDVIITISFTGTAIETNFSEDAPVMVYMAEGEYDKTFTWDDSEVELVEDEMAVVINLGDELEPGTYYLSFREGQVLVDGVANEGIEYMFIVESASIDDPGTDEPGTDNPGTDEPGTDEPGTDEPGTDNPGDIEAGISGINADENGTYHVYNMQGINILNTKESSDIRNLKGYYIINGKKVRF